MDEKEGLRPVFNGLAAVERRFLAHKCRTTSTLVEADSASRLTLMWVSDDGLYVQETLPDDDVLSTRLAQCRLEVIEQVVPHIDALFEKALALNVREQSKVDAIMAHINHFNHLISEKPGGG